MFVWSFSLNTLTELLPQLGHENTLGSVLLTVLMVRFLLRPNLSPMCVNERMIKCLSLQETNYFSHLDKKDEGFIHLPYFILNV